MKNEREVSKSRWLAGQASSQGFVVDKKQREMPGGGRGVVVSLSGCLQKEWHWRGKQ